MTAFVTNESVLGQDFLDFLVRLRQFILAELNQFLGTFQLLRHLVDVEFIILHLAYDGLHAASYFISFSIIRHFACKDKEKKAYLQIFARDS